MSTSRQRREFALTPTTKQKVLVVRPSDPALAMKIANEALANQDRETLARLQTLVEEAGGTYTFVGFLARRPGGAACIVDTDCKVLGELVPGDSFVSISTPPPTYGSQIKFSEMVPT